MPKGVALDLTIQEPITMIECALMKNHEDASQWVELKHTGENDGRGTVPWGTEAQQRFKKKHEGNSPQRQRPDKVMNLTLKIIDLLRKNNMPLAVPYQPTNLHRLLSTPNVRKQLGIKNTSPIKIDCPKELFVKFMGSIAEDLSERGALKKIYNKEDRLAYVRSKNFSYTPVSLWTLDTETLQKEKHSEKTTAAAGEKNQNSKETQANTEPDTIPLFPEKGKKESRSKQESKKRKHFIPLEFNIKINKPKINSLFKELKNIEHAQFLYATIILFRVFLECSAKEYISKNKLKGNPESRLFADLNVISEFFEKQKIMTKHELQPVRKMANDPNCFFSTRTFNAYVHNPQAIVTSAQELNNIWDTLEHFVGKLWE